MLSDQVGAERVSTSPKTVEIFFHWQCVADGRVEEGNGSPLGDGKPWLYTYNGFKGRKTEPKPKRRPLPIRPLDQIVDAPMSLSFVLPREAGAPRGEGWRDCGTGAAGKCYVRPALRHIDCRGVPLEYPVALALEGHERDLRLL